MKYQERPGNANAKAWYTLNTNLTPFHAKKTPLRHIYDAPSQCLLQMTTMVKMRPMNAAKTPKNRKGRHMRISFHRRASDILRCRSAMLECCGLSFIMVRMPAMMMTSPPLDGVL